jgi:hypothetical protein
MGQHEISAEGAAGLWLCLLAGERFSCRMNLFAKVIWPPVIFMAGFLVHAWSPWQGSGDAPGRSMPLAVLNYRELAEDRELEQNAEVFLKGLDANYPSSATERLLAVVMLQERYGEPVLAGYQISSYADRYIAAQAILTTHLLKDAPEQGWERYQRLRAILQRLNQHEAEYCCLDGGSGCWRDRRRQHMGVEDVVSRWALRRAREPMAGNPQAPETFQKLRARITTQAVELEEEVTRGPRQKEEPERAEYLKGKKTERDEILKALDDLANELRSWPPQTAEELGPLVLDSFQ